MNDNNEYHLHKQIAEYIRLKYPAVIFRSDLGGIKLTIGQAVKNKVLQMDDQGYPDLFIVVGRRGFHGLFLEFKKDALEIYTKNDKLRKNKHIQDQIQMMNRLLEEGYLCKFCWSFIAGTKILDWYLKKEKSHD